jgi:predicted nicotinamide N-methyase
VHAARSLDELETFVRTRTAPAPVPLVPEVRTWQATEVTPLWHATWAELGDWDDSPFWAFPWAGGQALARYLLDHPEAVRGRRVFDFASGSGLVAIAALLAGAASAVAADIDPFCAAVIPLNAALNGVALEVRAGNAIGDPLEGFDLLVAGDVFYERRMGNDSMAWFRQLAGRGLRVLAGDPGRLHSPRQGTRDLAAYEVPSSTEIEDRPLLRTWVLEILP